MERQEEAGGLDLLALGGDEDKVGDEGGNRGADRQVVLFVLQVVAHPEAA